MFKSYKDFYFNHRKRESKSHNDRPRMRIQRNNIGLFKNKYKSNTYKGTQTTSINSFNTNY